MNRYLNKSICLIAARGGSKGVPNKNIRMLGKKPLIAHCIETAIDSHIFEHVVVSTEDDKIAKIAKEFGAEIPFKRPSNFATDASSMTDVIEHAIVKLTKIGYNFDSLVNRDCTVPFINKSDILGALSLFQKTRCDLVCAVYRQHHNPYFNMMEINKLGFLRFSKHLNKKPQNRQDAPIVYQLNGLFVLNVKQFMKYRIFYMPKALPFEIPPERGVMIDTEFEFQLANMIATKKIKI